MRRPQLGVALAGGGVVAATLAVSLATAAAQSAADQAWPPFVLVAGLLLLGAAAERDGLFDALAGAAARLPGGGYVLLLACLAVVAAVTAVLNLDTSVVFLTPILLRVARRRHVDERGFLYGAVFMSNAASLLLPGANLTNLLVLQREHVAGTTFAMRLLPASLTTVVITAIVLVVVFPPRHRPGRDDAPPPVPLRIGPGVLGTAIAAIVILAVASPALWVLALGMVAALLTVVRDRSWRWTLRAINLLALLGLFGLAVGLGAVGRVWMAPANLLARASAWQTAGLAAAAACLLNNLPATVLLSAVPSAHPRALLVGLNLGPNLSVTGSLSALLWWQAARGSGARPSVRTYSLVGLLAAPAAIAGALLALAWVPTAPV